MRGHGRHADKPEHEDGTPSNAALVREDARCNATNDCMKSPTVQARMDGGGCFVRG
jgi:hypothetical protein